MKPATILRIHSIISSALDLAVRYEWADRNVARSASPPHPRKREPDPPSPDQAARLLNLVWAGDEEFGLYLWTAFTTGARRGEVSALRENRFDFTRRQVRLARNYLVKQGQHIEKAPKDGEGRVLSLDLLTCELFQERFRHRRAEARILGVPVPEDAFAFSPDPAGREPSNPDTITHRYRRYARRVDITSSLKELRPYSATQLLAAGRGDFADNQVAPPDEQARGQLLRLMASDAMRAAIERRYGVQLAFQNCHHAAVFRPGALDALAEFTSPAAQLLNQKPELVDC